MMKERVGKFDKFIKENEAKRRRAIQKYQTELRLKEQKTKEHEVRHDLFGGSSFELLLWWLSLVSLISPPFFELFVYHL